MQALRQELLLQLQLPHLRNTPDFINESLFVRCLHTQSEHAPELARELLGTFVPTRYSIEECFVDPMWLDELLRRAEHVEKNDFFPHMSSGTLEVLLGFSAVELHQALPYCEWWDYNACVQAILVFPTEAVLLDYVLCESDDLEETLRKVRLLLNHGSPAPDVERIRRVMDREELTEGLWDKDASKFLLERLERCL